MTVTRENFGTHQGREVYLYTLDNGRIRACVTNFGAILTQLHVPDRQGQMHDVVLGFDSLKDYLPGNNYFGAVIGRCANRIAGGRFVLEGRSYHLRKNELGRHHLHGGPMGFHQHLWDASPDTGAGTDRLVFERISPHMEEGYPGELRVRAVYSLPDTNELRLDLYAETDRTTIVNLTGHSYFNLKGHDGGPITDDELQINSHTVTETDHDLIPTGRYLDIKDGPLDFSSLRRIDAATDGFQSAYDCNYVLDYPRSDEEIIAAVLKERQSGRVMTLITNAHGLQFYTGHKIPEKTVGKQGFCYGPWVGLCLEPQQFPNAVNIPCFPPPILRPGHIYRNVIRYVFSIEG